MMMRPRAQKDNNNDGSCAGSRVCVKDNELREETFFGEFLRQDDGSSKISTKGLTFDFRDIQVENFGGARDDGMVIVHLIG